MIRRLRLRDTVFALALSFGSATMFNCVDAAEPNGATFDQAVAPFVAQHCVRCHGANPKDNELVLTGRDPAVVAKSDAKIWRAVLDRLRKNEMPPEGEARPAPADLKQAVEWLAKELGDAPKVAMGLLPSDGNKVDHDLLFNSPELQPLNNPPRFWRLSPLQYLRWADDITRAPQYVRHATRGIAQPFPQLDDTGFRDYALVFPLDEPTTDQLIRNAMNLASLQTGWRWHQERKRMILWNKKIQHTTEITRLGDPNQPPPTREDMQAGVRAEFNFVLLREPTDDELKKYTDLMEQKVATLGREVGVCNALAMILLLPEVVFHSECGAGEPDAEGRVMLTPRETSFALAYALTDARPTPELMRVLADGDLATPYDIGRQVRSMLDDPALDKPRILRFVQEYFGYYRATSIFKDDSANPDHDALIMVRDTDHLVRSILDRDQDVLRELLTTTKSFVQIVPRTKTEGGKQKAGKRRVWLSYNLDARPTEQPVTMPDDQRVGLLMQPSWLVAWSANTENHPIHRGKWVREKLLGGTIPDVPIGVDAQLPDDPHKTLRERMEVTNDAKCAHCHQKMNPLGLPFEQFDHFGRWRKTELDRPIVATGAVIASGDAELDGHVASPAELMRRLANSDRVRQVFIRHAFRYWMGRNENLGDARTLREADRVYVASGGSMKALIVSLLTSESFLYRTVQPAAVAQASSGPTDRSETKASPSA